MVYSQNYYGSIYLYVPITMRCEKMKTLIVYGTRYGATALTSQEIAKILLEENFEVKVVDAKKEKIEDISEFELVIVGGGL